MFLMRADPLRGHVGGGWAWKSRLFWALKWQRAKRVPYMPQKSPDPHKSDADPQP
jgi:hypothetical protein